MKQQPEKVKRPVLLDARKAKGLTQKEAAAGVGIHYTYWSRIENEGATPSPEIMGRIATLLDRRPDELFAELRGQTA